MTIVLFDRETGLKMSEFVSDEKARMEMRTANGLAGWKKLAQSWTDGIEQEWAENSLGNEDYAPYGITELGRWEERFRPEFTQQRKGSYAHQEE